MTDITLTPVTTGYNLSIVNNNFDTIEEVINSEVLHTVGGNNTMQQALDMNSNPIINYQTDPNDPTSLANVQFVMDTLNVDITDLQADIVTLQGEMVTAQGDITSLQGDVSTVQGDLAGVLAYTDLLPARLQTLSDNTATHYSATLDYSDVTLTESQSRASSFYLRTLNVFGTTVTFDTASDLPALFVVRTWGLYDITIGSIVMKPNYTYVIARDNSGPSLTLLLEAPYDTADKLDIYKKDSLIVACSDETTAIAATGDGKATFRVPYDLTVTAVKASVSSATATGDLTINIRKNGVDMLSTPITIEATEKTSLGATTQPYVSSTALNADDEVSIDLDAVGDGTAKGLKVSFICYKR